MRVISGERRGQKLLGPKNIKSRPTEDRIKEAVFNIIGPIKPDSKAVDLFACTGSIGIEFISRGACRVYLSELNRENIAIMERNLGATRFSDRAVILKGDFKKNLSMIDEKIDYIYIDPPYKSDYYFRSIGLILNNDFLKDALMITEMDKDENFSEKCDKIELVFDRRYGSKFIKIYKRKTDEGSISGKF